MNRYRNNMYDMFKRLKDFYTEKQLLIAVFLAVDATFQKFLGKLTQIDTINISLTLDNKGIYEQKKLSYDSLIDRLHIVTSVASVYYYQNNMLEKYQKTNSTASDYTHLREAILLSESKALHELINVDIVAMAGYGLTPLIMSELLTDINVFEALIQTPKEAIADHHEATVRIENLFLSANEILKIELDKVMMIFLFSNIGLYKNYKGMRQVWDLGNSEKEGVEFKCMDKITKAKLEGAVINLPNDYIDEQKESDKKGIVYFHIPGTNTYNYTATCEGKNPITGTVEVIENKLTKVDLLFENV